MTIFCFNNKGCLLFEMIAGYAPFIGLDEKERIDNILRKEIKFPEKYFSKHAMSLIKLLLDKNQYNRLNNIKNIKKHKFFKVVDWKRIKH